MSRKSREDQSTWEMPSIEVFNAGYGPFRAKGFDPIDNALIWFHYSTKNKDGQHPNFSLAGMSQELLLKQKDMRVGTIICIDLKDMFESEPCYEEALAKEIEEVDLTKGFGKKIMRLLQRMLLQNVIVASQKSFCAMLIKLYKAIYFIDPYLISELWLLHPEISTKFVNTHLVSNDNEIQNFKSTKVTLILEKEKNNRVGVLRYFFPKLEKLVVSTPNNWFSIIVSSKDSPVPPEPYDPEYINNLGERLFMSHMKVEMNRFSKQYERNCENTTAHLMEITSDLPGEEIMNVTSLDWSTCERHIGALVLRGNRCILARSLEKEWEGMRIPSVPKIPDESPHDAAIRAIVELAEVDASEVHILTNIFPVAIYAPDGRPILVELYPLYANNPPPDTPLEDTDFEDEDDLYDWYTFPNAMNRVDVASRAALRVTALNLIQAAHAGLLPVKWGGVFGQELNQLEFGAFGADCVYKDCTETDESGLGACAEACSADCVDTNEIVIGIESNET